ncbi:motile sperm domain-containing protein 2-like [Anticarsia gemmatalis]|uniref:motile sperm domain-containing protein 2-like n=1 Tax=Anticarsia gemmatalis TaxID=129554 RepID=UPI003F75DABF
MATPADVRALFEAKLKDSATPPDFHPLDLERAKDEKYLQRVLYHSEKDPKQAADMLWDILTWRKSVGASDINESNIRMDYVQEGVFFPRGRDIDGSLLLIFKAKMHVKGQREYEELKKIMIYWFDRVEREENGKRITMFFDMDGSGLGNMDMELVKYLITLFKLYYPYFLNYIVIYQMPWVLSAAFKVVKTLLPAKAVEKMKFVTKDTLKDIVAPEQALAVWGGKDNYVFEFIPESKTNSEHTTSKKVTFAEQGDSQHSPGEMLRLVPNDTIIFKNDNDEISGQFTITNMDDSAISFKIRTTAPEKFRVRPSSGTLASGASQTVLIVVQPGIHLRTVTKDRFLVMSIQIPKTDLNQKELSEIWQASTGSKTDEYRLKCQFPDKDIPKNGNVTDGKSPEKTDSVANSLSNLEMNYEMLHRDLQKLKWMQFLTLTITVFVAVVGYLIYVNVGEEGKYCERL